MNKKIAIYLLLVVPCALLLSGCGTSQPSGDAVVKETVKRDEEIKALATPKE